eukprot:229190-Amphidinium_carterae.1
MEAWVYFPWARFLLAQLFFVPSSTVMLHIVVQCLMAGKPVWTDVPKTVPIQMHTAMLHMSDGWKTILDRCAKNCPHPNA